MAHYNTTNSLSPMIFKKTSKQDKEGTRSERFRSKSMEHIFEGNPPPQQQHKRSGSVSPAVHSESCTWKEVDKLKAFAPAVLCVLPTLAMDFVASSLLAVGAVPLINEDPADIPTDLSNCKAVLVDTSAPQVIIEAFLDNFGSVRGNVPLVLVASNCGVNDRKKELALKIMEEVVPTMITGRIGDICALWQAVVEKTGSPLDSLSDMSDFSEEEITIPKVVVNKQIERQDVLMSSTPPVLRKIMKKKGSPPKVANGSTPSPSYSPATSPRSSPRSSPVPAVRGVKKYLKKQKCSGLKENSGMKRVPTVLPRIQMKGQFRETQMCSIAVSTGLEYAQKLCAHSTSYIHIYEPNVVTSGELVVEITNAQHGMGNLHSTLPCSGAVVAATLACVDLRDSEEQWTVNQCSHALALFYVAAEEAGGLATAKSEKGLVCPGTLKVQFLDTLKSLDEKELRSKAHISVHSEGLKS